MEDNPYHFLFGSGSFGHILKYAQDHGYVFHTEGDRTAVALGDLEICVINHDRMPIQIIRKTDQESFCNFYQGVLKTLPAINPHF